MKLVLCVSVIGLKNWPVTAGRVVTILTRDTSRATRLGGSDRADFSITLPAKTDLGPFFGEFHSQANPHRAMATVEEHIGTVNWQVNLQLSSLRTLRMTSTHMFLDLVDPLDTDLLATVEHLHNTARRGALRKQHKMNHIKGTAFFAHAGFFL